MCRVEERPNRGEGNTAGRVALSRGEAEGKSTRLAVFPTRGEVISSDPTHRDVFSLFVRGRRTKFITIKIVFCPKNLGWVIIELLKRWPYWIVHLLLYS